MFGINLPKVFFDDEPASEPVTRHPQPRIIKPDRSIVRKLKDNSDGSLVSGSTIATTVRGVKKQQTIYEALSVPTENEEQK